MGSLRRTSDGKRFSVAAVSTTLAVAICLSAASAVTAEIQSKEELLDGGSRATLSGGNGIYQVFVVDGAGGNCGRWTAMTGALHPAGANLNVLYGNGTPATSETTLRSYTSGTDYITGLFGVCTGLCSVVAPVITPIMNGATTVGYDFSWTFADGGNTIQFVQVVVVEGPVNGTETVDNTVIRETHTVRNLGPGSFSYGLRKHWDWQIGPDDGPWFGDCQTPTLACDTSMNMTATVPPLYPQSYIINDDPAGASCPAPVAPVIPAGCGGSPLYIVAGTVAPPSGLSPPPDAPELLQFNRWASLSGTCWQPGLVNNAPCGAIGFPSDDTAAAYFYGLTAATAEVLAANQEKSFTQYVVAGEDTCPEALIPLPGLDIKPGSCPNPLNRASQGYVPVAVVGSDSFDVTAIDVSSVRLSRVDGEGGEVAPHEGPPGPHSQIQDVAMLFNGEPCDCHDFQGDGIDDLAMKFKTQDVVAALELDGVENWTMLELVITGLLDDGSEFTTAIDCIRVQAPGRYGEGDAEGQATSSTGRPNRRVDPRSFGRENNPGADRSSGSRGRSRN